MTEYEVCQQNTMACEQEIAKGIIGQKDVIRPLPCSSFPDRNRLRWVAIWVEVQT